MGLNRGGHGNNIAKRFSSSALALRDKRPPLRCKSWLPKREKNCSLQCCSKVINLGVYLRMQVLSRRESQKMKIRTTRWMKTTHNQNCLHSMRDGKRRIGHPQPAY